MRKAFSFFQCFLYVYFVNTVADVSDCHHNEVFKNKINSKVIIRFIWHKFKLQQPLAKSFSQNKDCSQFDPLSVREMLNVTKTCPYKVLKMMSYADFPTVGCLLSWEIKLRELSLAQRAIASVKSFHCYVMPQNDKSRHTYFSGATKLSSKIF